MNVRTSVHLWSAVVLAIVVSSAHDVAADECEPMECTPPATPRTNTFTLEHTWSGGSEGRIAILVDDLVYNPEQYPLTVAALQQFGLDLNTNGGHPVVLYSVAGAEDFIRGQLWILYADEDSLSGAVLVGGVDYAVFEFVSGEDYRTWPTDAFYMDLDGTRDKTSCTDPACSPDYYDDWEGSEAEIWVSRIKVDNLTFLVSCVPGPGSVESKEDHILSQYFARNHEHRIATLPSAAPDRPFYPDETTLVYNNDLPGQHAGVDSIEQAFMSCDYDGSPSETEYLSALQASPRNYLVRIMAHGAAIGHSLEGAEGGWVDYSWYIAAAPNVVAFDMENCSTCEFSEENCLGGTICLNPDSGTLIVVGNTKVSAQNTKPRMWNAVGAGQSIGEGFKAMFNVGGSSPGPGRLGWVLLGDGSLKPIPTVWTGEGDGTLWSVDDNWEDPTGEWRVPGQYEHVQIDPDDVSSDGIQVDVGSHGDPHYIWGLVIKDSPDDLTLAIEANRDLRPRGSFTAESGASCVVSMAMGSGLVLERADLRHVEVNMAFHPTLWPVLDVAGVIEDVVMCTSNGKVDAGRIDTCDVTVGDGGEVTVEAGIANSAFSVSTDGLVVAGGSIMKGAGGSQEWTLNQARLEVDGNCYLGDDWTISGVATGQTYSAEIGGVLQGNEESGIAFTLQDGAKVDFEGNLTFPGSSEEFDPEHELVYGLGENELGGGLQEVPPNGDPNIMYFGDYTRIRALDEETALNLDLRSELHIASKFEPDGFVCQGWDSRGVDITVRPIWSEDEDDEQAIELISPELGESFPGDPLAFRDVPCQGAFRDLILPAWEPDEEHPADDPPVPVVMRNYYDNDASGGEQPETAVFRNMFLGANRVLKFYSDDGLIYYCGIFEMEDGANVYVDDVLYDVCGPACRGVVCTIYGDWNGDCKITNGELADLLSAIAGGSGTYDPLMDYDCDGVLTNLVELPAFLDNMRTQPSCERRGGDGGGGGGESGSESYEGYDDVPGLAAWLTEVLSEEQLKAFVADLAVAATEFADSRVGQDLAELLSCLE